LVYVDDSGAVSLTAGTYTRQIGQDADGELDVLIEDVSKFKCFFGVSRGNRAIQLTREIEE
jgi:flagellar motor switch protein FliM